MEGRGCDADAAAAPAARIRPSPSPLNAGAGIAGTYGCWKIPENVHAAPRTWTPPATRAMSTLPPGLTA